jgi:PRC-barrel domain
MLKVTTLHPGVAAKSDTSGLIGLSKVEGATVYNSRGDSVGSIHEVMIDKRSGKVAYAIMSFGGFLGIGQHYHTLPWEGLEYESRYGVFVLNAEAEHLLSRH